MLLKMTTSVYATRVHQMCSHVVNVKYIQGHLMSYSTISQSVSLNLISKKDRLSLANFYPTIPYFPHEKCFENFVEKGENSGYQHFLLFQVIFSTLSNTKSS